MSLNVASHQHLDGDVDDIGDAIQSLQKLLATKSKKLQDREEAFEQKVRLFDKTNPQAGKESDILELNVGGTNKIAVARKVLTHFEHSMLASKFSGRWDDSLEKDKEGNFFIDFDAEDFIRLISYLRLRAYKTRDDIYIPAPVPTLEFCTMLDYYDLMPALYPPKWQNCWGDFSVERSGYGQLTLESTHSDGGTGLIFNVKQEYSRLLVSSFMVTVEHGSAAQVGWSGLSTMQQKIPVGHGSSAHSNFGLDLSAQSFFAKGSTIEQEQQQNQPGLQSINVRENDVTVLCLFDGAVKDTRKYTIKVEGVYPEISESVSVSYDMYPAISFTGRATISNVQYHYPQEVARLHG